MINRYTPSLADVSLVADKLGVIDRIGLIAAMALLESGKHLWWLTAITA
ncbi:MAG: hypothetical protein ACSLEL_03845 [Candidatus Malihini olakiniferum]